MIVIFILASTLVLHYTSQIVHLYRSDRFTQLAVQVAGFMNCTMACLCLMTCFSINSMPAPSQILHNSTRGYGVEKYPVEQDPAFESQLEVTSPNPQTSHYVPPHLNYLTVQPHMM
jgi:hypothetical protein